MHLLKPPQGMHPWQSLQPSHARSAARCCGQVTADGSHHRYSANFRPASTDAFDINKPIGIPGAADWPSGQADQYYFVTVRCWGGCTWAPHAASHGRATT